MKRPFMQTAMVLLFSALSMESQANNVFRADSISRAPLELPEVIVESRQKRALHMLAYVREYSTLTTYTDTVFLFREKMVDYMLPSGHKNKFKGWSTPRVLTCKSYYRFTNHNGLDSVSDECRHHFSWSDWIGVPKAVSLPASLTNSRNTIYTLSGKYCPTETWKRVNDSIRIDIDVLADTASRRWVPNLAGFFREGIDYDNFKMSLNYSNIIGTTAEPGDLDRYSFSIESRGRGHSMFRFNRINEPYFVNTQADVYILDKEWITIKEAREWDKRKFDTDKIDILEPAEAPPVSASVETLIARVGLLDKNGIKLHAAPDHRLMSAYPRHQNYSIGHRALSMLKTLLGISSYKERKNAKKKWNNFIKKQIEKNRQRGTD